MLIYYEKETIWAVLLFSGRLNILPSLTSLTNSVVTLTYTVKLSSLLRARSSCHASSCLCLLFSWSNLFVWDSFTSLIRVLFYIGKENPREILPFAVSVSLSLSFPFRSKRGKRHLEINNEISSGHFNR